MDRVRKMEKKVNKILQVSTTIVSQHAEIARLKAEVSAMTLLAEGRTKQLSASEAREKGLREKVAKVKKWKLEYGGKRTEYIEWYELEQILSE